ncbi:MAG: hypothetical protein K2K55_04580 [Duncaniella sp.]|nr:hypothetical protein [Duncaniella sp.]
MGSLLADRLFAAADPQEAEDVKTLATEILESGRSQLTVRDGQTVGEAVGRLSEQLGNVEKVAFGVFFNPSSPILMRDLAHIAQLAASLGTDVDFRWVYASSTICQENQVFVLALSMIKS